MEVKGGGGQRMGEGSFNQECECCMKSWKEECR